MDIETVKKVVMEKKARIAFEPGTPMSKRSLSIAPCLSLADDGSLVKTGMASMYSKDSGILGVKLKAQSVVDLMNIESQRGARESDLYDLLIANHV
jgi:hypothetical protein